MSRAQKVLLAGEKIIFSTKLTWKLLIFPMLLVLIISLPSLLGNFGPDLQAKISYLILAGVPLLWLCYIALKRNASEFTVTNQRVVMYRGLPNRPFEIPLNKIAGITIDQDPIGKKLNYGNVVISMYPGVEKRFRNIQGPFEFKEKTEEQKNVAGHPGKRR